MSILSTILPVVVDVGTQIVKDQIIYKKSENTLQELNKEIFCTVADMVVTEICDRHESDQQQKILNNIPQESKEILDNTLSLTKGVGYLFNIDNY